MHDVFLIHTSFSFRDVKRVFVIINNLTKLKTICLNLIMQINLKPTHKE